MKKQPKAQRCRRLCHRSDGWNDAKRMECRACRREWTRTEREAATAPDLLETLAPPVEDSRLATMEAQDAKVQFLRDHVSAGRIG